MEKLKGRRQLRPPLAGVPTTRPYPAEACEFTLPRFPAVLVAANFVGTFLHHWHVRGVYDEPGPIPAPCTPHNEVAARYVYH